MPVPDVQRSLDEAKRNPGIVVHLFIPDYVNTPSGLLATAIGQLRASIRDAESGRSAALPALSSRESACPVKSRGQSLLFSFNALAFEGAAPYGPMNAFVNYFDDKISRKTVFQYMISRGYSVRH